MLTDNQKARLPEGYIVGNVDVQKLFAQVDGVMAEFAEQIVDFQSILAGLINEAQKLPDEAAERERLQIISAVMDVLGTMTAHAALQLGGYNSLAPMFALNPMLQGIAQTAYDVAHRVISNPDRNMKVYPNAR